MARPGVQPEFRELRLQVFQRGAKGGQAFFLLRDDLGRGACDETGVGELALGLGNFAIEPGDFLLQALHARPPCRSRF